MQFIKSIALLLLSLAVVDCTPVQSSKVDKKSAYAADVQSDNYMLAPFPWSLSGAETTPAPSSSISQRDENEAEPHHPAAWLISLFSGRSWCRCGEKYPWYAACHYRDSPSPCPTSQVKAKKIDDTLAHALTCACWETYEWWQTACSEASRTERCEAPKA